MSVIPVVDHTGRVVSHISGAQAALMPPCRQMRNRRGYVVRIRASADTVWTQALIALGRPSRWGQSFHQEIDSGKIWALKGVRGSRAA